MFSLYNTLLKSVRRNDELQEELRRAMDASPQWISVKERLPETMGYYLTCDHNGNTHIFYYDSEQSYPFDIGPYNARYFQPTHWMYLPEPPKEKENDRIEIPCDICGELYKTLVVEGHITYPHICSECFKKILLEDMDKNAT